MGADGYLVNIARGSVVDEEALVEALIDGRLAGAGLDVFADEPQVPEALLTMDNVVVLPHVGSGTVQTRAAMEELTLRNLDSFLASGQLVTPVPMPAICDRLVRASRPRQICERKFSKTTRQISRVRS